MQKSLRLLAGAALIGLGLWIWRGWFGGPEAAIRARLSRLASTASFEPRQGMMLRTYQVEKLLEFFTPDVVIDLDVRGYEMQTLNGRGELQQTALAATQLAGLKVEFLDVAINVGPDKLTAVANLTAKATVEGQVDFFVQEFNFMLKKVDGQWLIYRVESVKTLALARSGPAAA